MARVQESVPAGSERGAQEREAAVLGSALGRMQGLHQTLCRSPTLSLWLGAAGLSQLPM